MECWSSFNIHFVKIHSEKEKKRQPQKGAAFLNIPLTHSSDHSSPLGLRAGLVFYCLLPCGSGCHGNHHFGILMVSTSDSLWEKVQ